MKNINGARGVLKLGGVVLLSALEVVTATLTARASIAATALIGSCVGLTHALCKAWLPRIFKEKF